MSEIDGRIAEALTEEQERLSHEFPIDVYDPAITSWESIKGDILNAERAQFGENAAMEDELRGFFHDPEGVTVIRKDASTGKVVGFSTAGPADKAYDGKFHPQRISSQLASELSDSREALLPIQDRDGKTAYVHDTVLDPNFVGRKLVVGLVATLEKELAEKGYTYLDRDAAYDNGYAANVSKTYTNNGRLIYQSQPHGSVWGRQVYFVIRLPQVDK
ncbi:MAG: GNAT family N-acetyltransferase [Candidatus Levybacteria bacterium]|nr:GNAT family N-acetyltransferase [Candidatus Levybacteria bacterium]